MTKYKWIAFFGTVLMGISSFMACLGTSSNMLLAGSILLVISIVIMSYAFYFWRP
ncbi:hypothetical protein [Flavonifractor sp. An112]|uniref:hypothetical protein n=1 Tax=Flavonifractor sp. An112 TaxID=1965544 RepID=UPI00174E1C0A|nr:hypothetical protein [Flavonifractor sp. An112]